MSAMMNYGHYMRAPELSSNNYDKRADLWGLGLIAYGLMTRKDMFAYGNLNFWKIQIDDENLNFSV